MGAITGASTGASTGAAFGNAGAGAGVGAAIGIVQGVMEFNAAQDYANYQRSMIDMQISGLDTKHQASLDLLESKYNLKMSGIKSKKIDLNDEVLTKLDTESIKANQEVSRAYAMSVGSGVSGNARQRLQSAAKQSAELTRTNIYMHGKRQEGQLAEQAMADKSMTLAEKEFREVSYRVDRDILLAQRAGIQDPDPLSILF